MYRCGRAWKGQVGVLKEAAFVLIVRWAIEMWTQME